MKAFTLAEILITLGIIGVVAALTMPAVVQKYKEQATVAKVKKFYSAFSQAYTLAILENGTIDTWGLEASKSVINENGDIVHSDKSYEQYDKFFGIIGKYLKKVSYKRSSNYYVKLDVLDGYMLPDGTRIRGIWLANPVGCNTSKNKNFYCGDFYITTGKNDENFGFFINPERIYPFGTDDNNFKNQCLNGRNRAYCTGWIITNGNMDYLHCKDLSWNGKTSCK